MSTPRDGDASDRPDDPFGGRGGEQWPGYGSEYGAHGFGGGYGGRPYPDPRTGSQFDPGHHGAQPFYGAEQAYGGQQPYGMHAYGNPYPGQQPFPGQQSYGAMQPYGQYPPVARKDPALMLVASLLVPGLGTMLNGRAGRGIGILGGYVLGMVLSVILIGLPIMFGFWVWGMVDAYQGAKEHNARHGLP